MKEHRQQALGHLHITTSNGFIGKSLIIQRETCPRISCAAWVLLAPSQETGAATQGETTFLFSLSASPHLDWHLTETRWPIPFISSQEEMINTAGQRSSISLDRSTGVFIKPILMSSIHSCGQVSWGRKEKGRKSGEESPTLHNLSSRSPPGISGRPGPALISAAPTNMF